MDLDSCSSSRFEVSPYNPGARRRPGGIWNDDTLPVTAWEAAEHRVVLPEDLQIFLGVDTPVLRWAQNKRDLVLSAHSQANERRQAERVDFYLSTWDYAGADPRKPGSWHVFFVDEGRRTLVVFGRDANGSMNMVTLYSPKRPSALKNRINRGKYLKRE